MLVRCVDRRSHCSDISLIIVHLRKQLRGIVQAVKARVLDLFSSKNTATLLELTAGYSNLIVISIYTTFLHYKCNELQSSLTPSPAGEGWGEENKNNHLYPPHPNLLPQGRRGRYLCRYLCLIVEVSIFKMWRLRGDYK